MIKKEFLMHGATFIDSDSLEDYLVKIEKNAEFLIHFQKGRCAGFIAYYANDFETKKAFITMVLVDEEMRGKKIAFSLIQAVLQRVKTIGFLTCSLEVKKPNTAAVKLYEKLGFSVTETKSDSFVMSISL